MTAPRSPSRSLPAVGDPDSPTVRFDVRLGSGRPTTHQLSGVEFRIGGSSSCDVVLPGAHVPPIVCRFARDTEGLGLRKTDLAFPVLLNGSPVFQSDVVRLQNGDRVAVGPADLTVSIGTGHLRPKFVPLGGNESAKSSLPRVEVVRQAPETIALQAERDRLVQLSGQLEEQARELEADRVLWYRRRQEIEAECRAMRSAPRMEDVSRKETELVAREQEIHGQRMGLEQQYEQRRSQIEEMTASLRDRQRQLEEETARRRQGLEAAERRIEERVQTAVEEWRRELDLQHARRQSELEAEWAARQPEQERDVAMREVEAARREERLNEQASRHATDLARLDRWQASLAERQRDLDRRAVAVDARLEQLTRDTLELEENVRLAGAEQERLTIEADRSACQKRDLETHAAKLAERSAQLEAQQAMLAVLRARLDRQQEEARDEAVRLTADRARVDNSQRELDDRLREAERLRAELTTVREDQAEQQKVMAERSALLETTLAEIQFQKDAIAEEQTRLANREAELDARSADMAEQTAVLKARANQVMELQERLETDRSSVRTREATLTDGDTARQAFQEHLRRRSEEIAARSRLLDETAGRQADEKAELDQIRTELQSERERTRQEITTIQADIEQRTRDQADRETNLQRQIARLREAGRAVAAARKDIAESKERIDAARQEVEEHRRHANEEVVALRREAPELDERAAASLERLTSVREMLRGQLGELHAFAGQSREGLDALRADLEAQAERLREREQSIEKARAEHRLSVTEFRQQLIDWQSHIGELKQTLARSESRVEARHAEVSAATRQTDAAAAELARQSEELRLEKERVAERRSEIERHLADMREWYRKKLRELAASNTSRGKANAEPAPPMIAGRIGGAEALPDLAAPSASEDVDPGDRQLGELLRSLELVDADTLSNLWAEAARQRRTLRHVLLASGAVTLYQLALIEAGNLDGLMLGRLRVVDRLRVTQREAVYRVYDPSLADGASRGVFLLRHLAESEMDDAIRPDEFRQRFAAAGTAADTHLAKTLDVLEIHSRPAVLQEWVTGLPSSEWPVEAVVPGVWVKLFADAASGIDAAHRAGLVHGRLTADSFVLTGDGVLKVTGFGEPPWLVGGPASAIEPTSEADLRALGQVAYEWTQTGQATRRRGRSRAFPESLTAVVRRLEADTETPMADTVAGAVPYRTAADLVADLARLAALFPCPPDAWDRLVRHVASMASDEAPPIRQSA